MSDLQNSTTQKQVAFSCLNISSEDYRKALGFDVPKPALQPSSYCTNKPKNSNKSGFDKNRLTPQQFRRAQEIFMQDVEILKYLENKYRFKIYEDKKLLARKLVRLKKLWRIKRQVADKKNKGKKYITAQYYLI